MANSDSENKFDESRMRDKEDRSDDPLFVPHFDEIEEFRSAESAPGPGPEYSAILESICGATDDSQAVERYDGTLGVTTAFVDQHQSAVCQVQWNDNLGSVYTNPGNVSNVRWGTGTMIAEDIMITCGHLFDQTGGGWQRPRSNGSSNIISPQEIAENMQVNFNFQVDSSGNAQTETSFAILELIEYRLGGVDMAICRISGNPGATFGTARVSTTDASVGNMICIIGHPAGQPKRIEAGPTTQIDGNFIRYNDIDTLGGNSGSGILRASDGGIVGVHTNGGCGSGSPGPTGGSNYGLRIERFIEVSPTLQAISGPQKIKFSDDNKLKFSDDNKFKFSDDGKPKFSDDNKFKFSDDNKLKFSDDNKRKAVDDKFKNIDDVKSVGLDKGPLDNFGGGFAGGQGVGGRLPGVLSSTAVRRPFALGHGHHAANLARMQGAELEATMAQIEGQMAELINGLSQLEATYSSLQAEYESLTGGSNSQ